MRKIIAVYIILVLILVSSLVIFEHQKTVKKSLMSMTGFAAQEDDTTVKTRSDAEKQRLSELKAKSAAARSSQARVENMYDQIVGNTLNKYLGSFAYGWIDDVCKDKWESSEPESTTPSEITSDPGIDATQGATQEVMSAIRNNPQGLEGTSQAVTVCSSSLHTTYNVYAKKKDDKSFLISYVIQACNPSWAQGDFMIVLDGEEQLKIEEGIIRYGEVKSSQKIVQAQGPYSKVCISIEGEQPFCNNISE